MKYLKKLSYVLLFSVTVLGTALSTVACTKADPKLDSGSSLSLKLDSSSTKISSPNQPVMISGACDKRMSGIEVSINGGAWVNAKTLATTHEIKCSSTKRFSFTLDPATAAVSSYFGFVTNVIDTRKVAVRGQTVLGAGVPANFMVTYEPTVMGPSGMYVLAGNSNGQRLLNSSGSTFKLQGRIGVQSLTSAGDNTSSSSGFVLKSGMQRDQ